MTDHLTRLREMRELALRGPMHRGRASAATASQVGRRPPPPGPAGRRLQAGATAPSRFSDQRSSGGVAMVVTTTMKTAAA